jgi:hypothetical protein
MTPLRVKQAINVSTPTLTYASQAEAEAGVDNTKLMTPLRVKEAVLATAASGLTYIGEFSISGGTIEVAYLGSYRRLIIQGVDLTASSSAKRALRVSTNNGSTWLTSSSTYNRTSNNGGVSEITGHDSSSSGARSPYWEFFNFGTTDPIKPVRNGAAFGDEVAFVNTALALNAIQVSNGSGNLTGGVIHIWGSM